MTGPGWLHFAVAVAAHPGQHRPVLATVVKTPDDEIDEYLQVLAEMAEA